MNALICLIILTSQCVHSKVININSDNGTISTECCVHGACVCSSLYTALANITSYTMINITSKSVALINATRMGSGNLTNITITGSNVTIMCNNSGNVYCESCDNVMIEGITWDSCGDPNGAQSGVTFNGTSNFILKNCTFQHSQVSAVSLLEVSKYVFIQHCYFLSNIPMQHIVNYHGTVSITRLKSHLHNLSLTIRICESFFYNNRYHLNATGSVSRSSLNIDIEESSTINCNFIMEKTTFMYNENAVKLAFYVLKLVNIQLSEILVVNNSGLGGEIAAGITFISLCESSNVIFSVMSSNFYSNCGGDLYYSTVGNIISFTLNESNFTDGKPAVDSAIMSIICDAETISKITFYKVQFNNNVIPIPEIGLINGIAGAVSISSQSGDVEINLYMVDFISNQYLAHGALCILLVGSDDNYCKISVKECKFMSNISPANGVVLYVYTVFFDDVEVQIERTLFDQNMASISVVYIAQESYITQDDNIRVDLIASSFTNNVASSMFLSASDLQLSGVLLFENNTAENGGAMYLNQGSTVTINDEATVQFVANKATLNGGAIYVDFRCDNSKNDVNTFDFTSLNYSAIFVNNSAAIAGNSLYFNIPGLCPVNRNISNDDSILHVPCQFNYFQPVNGRMMQHIPCDLNYTLLNGTGAPIVTSPHELRLYFPYNEGHNILSTSNPNTYYIKNNILGHQVRFTGAVFDYFGKPAEPTQFNIRIQRSNASKHSMYTLIGDAYDRILTHSIDNITIPDISFQGKRIDNVHVNLTVILSSLTYLSDKIVATLIVELIPCTDHPGYMYSEDLRKCICYHTNIKCSGDVDEIRRGYWFGSIASKATTSFCPNHYCEFIDHKQISEGYFELPNTINAQCNHHRVGRACGECSSGYTLSYDSTDCISVHQCGAGWTALVIVSTCLYWVAIVVGVFILMYLKFQISLGYLYGIIYYYSMVSILLDNNPYVSDDTFQFVSVLSSFAQLTPRFLGKLCFVKGLSGIDQLFIHYSHAVAISLVLILIIVITRFSARIALFVSRCIIRVICLLILLAYTSIASTSLQLLQPLRFTGVKEWYAYSSPRIQYFCGRHAIYGVVAIICELVIGIGLPLLLLFEPFLSRKINFIKIKPLLDQFQGCYKDKYRCFAAYYLICRQVIFLILYTFNSNYYDMLFYLQTVCVVSVLIHMWFQPYRKQFLNALDGLMLSLIVFEININTFPFLKDVTVEIVMIIVIIPLLLISSVAIKNVSQHYLQKYRHRHYDPITQFIRFVCVLYLMYIIEYALLLYSNADPITESDEPPDYQEDNYFQEPLFNLASNNN